MQLIVVVEGGIPYLLFPTVTPSLGLRMLYLLGGYVVRSSWISDQLKECKQGNILEDYPTSTHKLSSNVMSLD